MIQMNMKKIICASSGNQINKNLYKSIWREKKYIEMKEQKKSGMKMAYSKKMPATETNQTKTNPPHTPPKKNKLSLV